MSQNSTMGRLLSTFRYQRDQARKKAEADLWKENNLSNPKLRQDYEIHESSVTAKDGVTVIALELWHKVDMKRIQINVDVQSEEIKTEIGDLIDG